MSAANEAAVAEAAAMATRIKELMHEQGMTNAQAFLTMALGLSSMVEDVCASMPVSQEGREVVSTTLQELSEASSVGTVSSATANFLVNVAMGMLIVMEQSEDGKG